MSRSTRINIPVKAGDLIKLAEAMEEQHIELEKDSPLGLLDWKTVSPLIKEASDINSRIEKMNLELEKLTERRNNLVSELSEFVRQGRDILSGVYRSEMKKLVDFGFAVEDTPRSRKTLIPEKKAA